MSGRRPAQDRPDPCTPTTEPLLSAANHSHHQHYPQPLYKSIHPRCIPSFIHPPTSSEPLLQSKAMARRRASYSAPLLFFSFLAVVLAAAAADDLTTFKLYFHDVVGGTRPTAIRIAQAPSSNSSSTFFGAVVAIDDPLTTGPDRSSSPEIGRAQGTYTFADQKTFGLLMQMNFVFTGGDHNGSSLAILGRNEVLSDVREMSIVGGTGKFRMARGYVQAHTVDPGTTSGETVVQYTVNVKA